MAVAVPSPYCHTPADPSGGGFAFTAGTTIKYFRGCRPTGTHGGSNNPPDYSQEPPFESKDSKSAINGWDGWIRTSECRRQRPMPYRLATPPYSFARNSVTLKITRCVRSASQGYMGWVKGLEPSTLGTTIRCSNQLSYTHHIKNQPPDKPRKDWHARRDSNPRPTA